MLARRARSRARDAPVILDVHGDWRTLRRGSTARRARRVLAPLADRCRGSRVRGADAVRTISAYTSGLVRDAGVEPAADRSPPSWISTRSSRARRRRCPSGPWRSSSACSSATRPSTCSPTPGGSPRRACPKLACGSSAAGRRRDVVERLVARAPPGSVAWDAAARDGRRRAARSTPRPCSCSRSRSEGLGRGRVEALLPRPRRRRRARRRHPRPRRGRRDRAARRRRATPRALADALVRVLSDRELAERLGAAGARRRSSRGWRRPRSTRARVRRARRARSCERAGEARRRHAAGRPGEPGARRHRGKLRALAARVDELVVLADSRGRRRAAGQLPRAPLRRRATKAGRGAALRGGARPRARAPPAAGGRARAHVPDLRRARGAARAAARRAASSSGSRTGARAGCCGSPSALSTDVITRRPPLVPARLARSSSPIGHGIDLTDFPCVERGPERDRCAARARAHVAGEGARDGHPRRRAASDGAR